MTRKDKQSYGEVVNIDSNDVEIFGPKGSINSVRNEVAVAIAIEAVKAVTPIALEAIKKKFELDQETQKLVRDDKRKILNKQAEILQSQIEKEEANENYNQERIDRWSKDLEGLIEKLDDMDAKSGSFTKGMLFTMKELINSKRN